jgi:hypothetical protein
MTQIVRCLSVTALDRMECQEFVVVKLTTGEVKSKVKVTLVQALRLCTGRAAYRESRGIALLFHDHGTRRG